MTKRIAFAVSVLVLLGVGITVSAPVSVAGGGTSTDFKCSVHAKAGTGDFNSCHGRSCTTPLSIEVIGPPGAFGSATCGVVLFGAPASCTVPPGATSCTATQPGPGSKDTPPICSVNAPSTGAARAVCTFTDP